MTVQDGDIIRVVAKMSWGEDDIQNVYHLKASVTTPPSDEDALDDIVEALDTYYDYINANIANEVAYDTIEAYNITQDSYIGEIDWLTVTTGEGTATDPLPPQLAPLILFGTGQLRSQGRKYLPPHVESVNDADGTPISALVGLLNIFGGYLLNGVIGTGWIGDFGNYRPLTDTFIEWITAEARDIWATQRRRMFGRGT